MSKEMSFQLLLKIDRDPALWMGVRRSFQQPGTSGEATRAREPHNVKLVLFKQLYLLNDNNNKRIVSLQLHIFTFKYSY